jgi:hypothetical protein
VRRRQDNEERAEREKRFGMEQERLDLAKAGEARAASAAEEAARVAAENRAIQMHDAGFRDAAPIQGRAAMGGLELSTALFDPILGEDHRTKLLSRASGALGDIARHRAVPEVEGKLLDTEATPDAMAARAAAAKAAQASEEWERDPSPQVITGADGQMYRLNRRTGETSPVTHDGAPIRARVPASGGGGGGVTPRQAVTAEDTRRRAMISRLDGMIRDGSQVNPVNGRPLPDDPRLPRMRAVADSLAGEMGAPPPTSRTNPLDEFSRGGADASAPIDPRKQAHLEARRRVTEQYAADMRREPHRAEEWNEYFLEAIQAIDAEHGARSP